MTHNVLVLASAPLPARAGARRRLGLPPGASFPAPDRRGARDPAWIGCPYFLARIENLPPSEAQRLRRLMCVAGGGAETTREAVLLGGSGGAYLRMTRAVRRGASDPETRLLAEEIEAVLAAHAGPPRDLALRSGRLALGAVPLVMGVLNVTPDSFSDGGRYRDAREAVSRAMRMAEEGARILDVGAESTRPGSRPVPLAVELRRLLPVLERLVPAARRLGRGRPLISVDTYKAEVARRAADAGADMINDVSGLTLDPSMPAVVAESGLPVVLQHMRGRPATMQRSPRYGRLIPEIAAFLRRQIDLARRAGVREDRIVVDPGLGFGKRRHDNQALLRHLAVFRSLGKPVLIGASRKSFIGGVLEAPVTDRLEGSLAAEALAIAGGADMIRAHDVREAVRVARLCAAILRDGS